MSQSFKKHLATVKGQFSDQRLEALGLRPLLALLLLALALVALIGGVIGYNLGQQQGHHAATTAMKGEMGEALTPEMIQSLRLENDILKTETTTLTQERDISLNNVNLLRDEIEALKLNNAQLMQLNDVLSQEVVKDGGIPLGIVAAQIAALPENGYEYRFDVAMMSKDGKPKKLTPTLVLLNETSMVEVPIKPASYEVHGVAHIRGRFIMPEGFHPQQMKLTLSADGKKKEQLYDWRVGKVIDNAPSRLAEVSAISAHPIDNSSNSDSGDSGQ